MKKQRILILLLILLSFSNCRQEKALGQITNTQDYEAYLSVENIKKKEKETSNLQYWRTKYEQLPDQYPYLSKIAGAHTQLFATTGNIQHLLEAENYLKSEIAKKKTAANLRALAKNYISQHKFQEALKALLEAESNGEKLAATQKMLFDVHLELGNYEKAKSYLDKSFVFSDFDYLIRAAKWNDVQGNLTSAIYFLEKAFVLAKERNNKALQIWSYTNLADFYGHHNEIEKSYQYYLKALELDRGNAYAKKGIAWIVYSHEKNIDEARRILNSIKNYHHSPDYFLFLAELSEFENKLDEKMSYLNLFKSAVMNSNYGRMYDQHMAKLYLDELENYQKATALIERELKNRKTPETYDLLAWSYFKKGELEKSLTIVNTHIKGQTHEPEVLYHMAEIYKYNDMKTEALVLKKELLDSSFEIGPLLTSKVQGI